MDIPFLIRVLFDYYTSLPRAVRQSDYGGKIALQIAFLALKDKESKPEGISNKAFMLKRYPKVYNHGAFSNWLSVVKYYHLLPPEAHEMGMGQMRQYIMEKRQAENSS